MRCTKTPDARCAMADPTGFPQAFLTAATAMGDAPFLHDWASGQAYSRHDLCKRAARIAAGARQVGLQKGDIAIIASTDQITSFTAMLGLAELGAATLYADFRRSADELRDLARHSGAAHVFSDFPPLLRTGVAAPLPETDAAAQLTAPWDADTVQEIGASSGTTGLPRLKPVMAGRALQAARSLAENGARGAWGDALSCLNLAFSATRMIWYRNALSGHRIVVLPQFFRLDDLDAALRSGQVEEATLPPRLIRMLNEAYGAGHSPQDPRYPNLAKLQSVGGSLTGAPLTRAYRELTPKLVVTYSSTQTGVISRLDGPDILRKPHSVGRSLPDQDLSIGPPEAPCPAGVAGPIHVCAHSKDAEWITPGDRGFVDEDGFLHIAGRDEDYLCRNGVSFWAAELVDTLCRAPGVQDAVIVTTPGSDMAEDTIIAAVEADPAQAPALCDWATRHIGSLHRPDRLFVTRNLPRNSADKIARAAILSLIETHAELCHDLSCR